MTNPVIRASSPVHIGDATLTQVRKRDAMSCTDSFDTADHIGTLIMDRRFLLARLDEAVEANAKRMVRSEWALDEAIRLLTIVRTMWTCPYDNHRRDIDAFLAHPYGDFT